MKFIGFCLRRENKSGIILIVVLWMLAILSVLAIGLGRTARLDLSLAKHYAGKVRSDFLTWAAMYYVMDQVHLDTKDPQASLSDTVYRCGFSLGEGKTPKELFRDIALESGNFTAGYFLRDAGGKKDFCYGLQDEERFLNLNSIHQQNERILVHVLTLLGLDAEQAEGITAQIIGWKEVASQKTPASAPTQARSRKTTNGFNKKGPFENVEELMLLKGMEESIFEKMKSVVTVFPRQDTGIAVNVNTALPIILQAIFRFCAEENLSVSMADADRLIKKIIDYRKGKDGLLCTVDDLAIDKANAPADLGLDVNERAIFIGANNYLKETSDYFRVNVKGVENQFGVATQLEAVLFRETGAILRWKRK